MKTSTDANVIASYQLNMTAIQVLKDNLKHLTIEELTRLKGLLVGLDKSIYYEIKTKMESPKNKYKVVI